MARKLSNTRIKALCPYCMGEGLAKGSSKEPTRNWTCAACGHDFEDRSFYAHGEEAMESQVAIVNYYHKMATIRILASYAVSAIVAGAILLFVPAERAVAGNIIAGAFVIFAAGIAGFTRFRAKAPGLDVSGDRPGK